MNCVDLLSYLQRVTETPPQHNCTVCFDSTHYEVLQAVRDQVLRAYLDFKEAYGSRILDERSASDAFRMHVLKPYL